MVCPQFITKLHSLFKVYMEIKVGSKVIGFNRPTFIIAEMSGNHGKSFEKAKEIIYSAKRAGADAIKLQTYKPDTITLNCNSNDFRIPNSSSWQEYDTLWKLYTEAYTPWEWHSELYEIAHKLDLIIFSSPFDESAVDFLEKLNTPIYKIASPEIVHIPLLEKVASTGKPVILSSGIANYDDISLAVSTLLNNGCKEIILLKCNTAYPAPLSELNLKTISSIFKDFGVLPGISDHTVENIAALAAVSMGAVVVEKHFSGVDDEHNSVDSFFSCGESDFKKLVKSIRDLEQAIGEISYDISSESMKSFGSRRSFYVSEDIKKGDTFNHTNLRIVRPGHGLEPKNYKLIYGKIASRDMQLGEPLKWDCIL